MRLAHGIANMLTAIVLFAFSVPSARATDPTNIDCEHALSFCEDLSFPFDKRSFNGCLWFSFEVGTAQFVKVNFASTGGKIGFIGPYSSSDPCHSDPPPTCAVTTMNSYGVNSVLSPGVYYFVVSYPSGTGSNITIDVVQGINCGEGAENIDCEHALSFCDDVFFPFQLPSFMGCLWFSFVVEEAQQVKITFSSMGGKIGFHGPFDPENDPCKELGCIGTLMDTYTVDATLQPGTYYFTVGYPSGIPDDITIDVIRGLGCGGDPDDPTNIDCATALPFCADLTQAFSTEWANHYDGCLWYIFTLDEASQVQINIASPGSKIHVYPVTTENPCPRCGSGAMLSGESELDLNTSLQPGQYLISVGINEGSLGPVEIDVIAGLECLPCDDCIPPFELEADTKYIITAWAHVPGQPGDTPTFGTPKIQVESPPGTTLISFGPTGPIIDGWQRMEQVFTTPDPYSGLKVQFLSTSGIVYYDDIRIFPEKASMKCYVYDPINLRFVAELDERHYATFYEYDAEGKLTRVKKETERGIMTIQETRNNSSKLTGP